MIFKSVEHFKKGPFTTIQLQFAGYFQVLCRCVSGLVQVFSMSDPKKTRKRPEKDPKKTQSKKREDPKMIRKEPEKHPKQRRSLARAKSERHDGPPERHLLGSIAVKVCLLKKTPPKLGFHKASHLIWTCFWQFLFRHERRRAQPPRRPVAQPIFLRARRIWRDPLRSHHL